MKKRMGLIAAALLFAVLFFSCDMLNQGLSIENRVNGFMSDVNAGKYSSLYTHFHPSETSSYNEIKAPGFWNTPAMFPSGNRYTLGAVVPAGTFVTTTISGGAYNNTSIVFVMAKDGTDYKIKTLTIGGASTVRLIDVK